MTSSHSLPFFWLAMNLSNSSSLFILRFISSRNAIVVVLQVVVYLAFHPSEYSSHVLVIVGIFFAGSLDEYGRQAGCHDEAKATDYGNDDFTWHDCPPTAAL
jgi:hypothetical protein